MNENTVLRHYLERSTSNDAAYEALAWVGETGGTIITNVKGTFKRAFDLATPKEYSSFASKCCRYRVGLETMRGGYSVKGERLVYLYLIGEELTKVESRLSSIGIPGLKDILLVVWNKESVRPWIEHYHAKPLNCAAGDNDPQPSEAAYGLPEDISRVLEHLATMAAGYGNSMKWNEEAKLKSDLMKNRQAWMDIPIGAIRQKCSDLGMALADTNTIIELVEKAQAGKRLVPESSYKNFEFKH